MNQKRSFRIAGNGALLSALLLILGLLSASRIPEGLSLIHISEPTRPY